MQPSTQESIAQLLDSKAKHKSFYDSPGAIEHANYQLLTPMSGTSFTSFQNGGTPRSANGMHDGLNNVISTAEKKRNQATEALYSVTKALAPRGNGAPYVRVSPGHFLLPTTSTIKPTSTAAPPKQQLALGSPFSATPPSRGTSLHRTGDVVENLAATLKSLSSGNVTPTPASATTTRRINTSLAMTPLSSSSRLGRIVNNTSTGMKTTPGSRSMPSSVNFMNNNNTAITSTPAAPPTMTTLPSMPTTTSAVSHKLSELQKHHSDLLSACHEAESAATRAKAERKKAQEELKIATVKLENVEGILKEQQLKLEEMAAAQHTQQDQLRETAAKLTAYQAEASETKLNLEIAKNESREMEIKLQSLKEEWNLTQTQAQALQIDTFEAQQLTHIREELQKQVDTATASLESLLKRQSHAEHAAFDAENRFIAASSTLQVLEMLVASQNEALLSTEALVAEAEALLEEKTARAADAQREWVAAEEKLGAVDSALVEVTARLEAKRQLVAETEQRCAVLERELRCAEEYTTTATAAAANAEKELSSILLSVDSARADESIALEQATEAEARAELACELADAEEQRAEEAAAMVAELEKRQHSLEAAAERLKELEAEIGQAESIFVLQNQLLVAIDERDALLDELESAQEYGAVAASAAQRAQQLGEDIEAKMQSTLAQSEALILELEVKLAACRLEEAEQRKGRIEAETLATNALAEVERLAHSHFSINEAKLLEAELNETREQLTRAANAAETAAQRATLAEKQVDCADSQLTLALVERDAALDRVDALCTARDIAVSEIAELKKEAAHREAAFEEVVEHQDQMESVLRTLKQERGEAKALAEALNLQVEALEDRLRAETGRRVMLEQMKMSENTSSTSRGNTTKKSSNISASSAAATAGASAPAPEVEKLMAQNATLKATATRLSKALAVALQKSSMKNNASKGTPTTSAAAAAAVGGGSSGENNNDFIPALHSPSKIHRQLQHPWNSSSGTSDADLSAVLEQLQAVESLLSS
jgi:hypothetical protein